MKKFTTDNAKETQAIAVDLAKRVRGGDVVALYGELGTGKTTFTQAFAKTLGVKERVQSPTFILMHEHQVRPARKIPTSRRDYAPLRVFLHVDAYRGDAKQFRAIGLEEYLGRPDTVVLIEWADRVEELLPKKRIQVFFKHLKGNRRRLSVKS